jgi:tetratricopeptide (TPR) repeat protein
VKILYLLLATWISIVSIADASNSNDNQCNNIKQDTMSLLFNSEYSKLNELVDRYQISFVENTQSTELNCLILAIKTDNIKVRAKMKPLLDEWVNRYPLSYQPLLCRGAYYTTGGWIARGDKYISDTRSEQIGNMESQFEKATNDFKKALNINKNIVHAYVCMIEIAAALGLDTKKEFLDRALAIKPISGYARYKYINYLRPRWGGSIEEMKAFVEESRPLFKIFPQLAVMEGEIPYELCSEEEQKKNYAKAIIYCTEAIKLGQTNAYYDRHYCYASLRLYKEALQDLDNLIALQPENIRAYEGRVSIRWQAKDYLGYVADLNKLISFNPENAKYYTWRATGKAELHQYVEAVRDQEEACRLEPANKNYKRFLDEFKNKLNMTMR